MEGEDEVKQGAILRTLFWVLRIFYFKEITI